MKLLVLTLALASSAAVAQTPPDRMEVWAGGGLGFQTTPLFAGAGAHVSAGRGVAALRVGYDGAEEFTLGATPTSLRAVSLSAEARRTDGSVHLSAFAGPALVWGLGRYESQSSPRGRTPYQTTGLALGGAAFVELGPGFGLGINVSGNVNPEVSSVGVRLATHFKLQ